MEVDLSPRNKTKLNKTTECVNTRVFRIQHAQVLDHPNFSLDAMVRAFDSEDV